MKLKEMLSILVPSLKKNDIITVLHSTQKELKETTIPVYVQFDEQFSNWNFKSKEVKRLIPTFNAIVKKKQGNIITTVKWTLNNIVKMQESLIPYLDKHFTDTTVASSITYKKAQYLQLLDAIKFYTSFSRDFLNYVLVAETGEHDRGNTLQKSLTPAKIKYIESGLNNFWYLTDAFNQDVHQVMKLLDDVPDIIIKEDNIELIEATNGKNKVDPMKMGFISANQSPFYSLMVKYALWQHSKYEMALEERELIKLRILDLKKTLEGNPDPAIQKQIDSYQNLVNKLDYKISKVEKEYA